MEQVLPNQKIVVIGAGPVGLAAAARLLERGLDPLVLEQGAAAGAAMLEWGHVAVFTPWKYVTDDAVAGLLEADGWTRPDPEHLPTGREIVEEYLKPAAALPALSGAIEYDATVVAVSKRGLSKSSSSARNEAPFVVHYQTADGQRRIVEARAVIDASGTWRRPNPMGADGLPVPGEADAADRIAYGIPHALGPDRDLYAGKTTFVLGGGHSAINAVLDLLKLKDQAPATRVIWALRNDRLEKLLGGGVNDELPARGALGVAAKAAIASGALELLAPATVSQIDRADDGLYLELEIGGHARSLNVDRIVVATGFRPDLEMLRELRLDLDEVVEAPRALAPLIDPNLHSCGTVPPHGVLELAHPEANFFIVGMKAYGRAPTFLMKTGYEQVRSIAAELAGDRAAARRVELVLPETGVCNGPAESQSSGCCGAPTPEKETISAGCCV